MRLRMFETFVGICLPRVNLTSLNIMGGFRIGGGACWEDTKNGAPGCETDRMNGPWCHSGRTAVEVGATQ